MSTKIKVENKNPFNVGLELMDNGNGHRGINVLPNSFAMLDEDEIYHQDSKCTLFKNGVLTINNTELNEALGLVEKNPNSLSEAEIEVILMMSLAKMKKELEKITEPFAISKVFLVAKKIYSELSGGKIDYIAEFCGKEKEELSSIKDTKTK